MKRRPAAPAAAGFGAGPDMVRRGARPGDQAAKDRQR